MSLLKIKIICLFLVLAFLNLTILTTIDDSLSEDLGRHLTIGRIINQTHQVPKTNLFSHTQPDHVFINHHWLSQLVFWKIYQSFGLTGLFVLKLALFNLTCGLLFLALAGKRKSTSFFILPLFALGLSMWKMRFDLRPELFSYLLLSLFLLILHKPLTLRRSMALAILQAFWVNTHIYFFIGPLLVLITQLPKKQELKRFFLYFSLISGASLLNPHFLTGAIYPLTVFGNYGYTVAENQPFWFLERYFKIFGYHIYKIFLVITSLSLVVSLKRKQISASLLQVFGLIFSLVMIRNFPLLLFFALGPIIQNLNFVLRKQLHFAKKDLSNIIYISGFLFLMIVFASLFIPKKANVYRPHFEAKYAPLVEFLEKNPPQGHIFNNYDPGSYLIFKLYPKNKVFVDNRPEAYSEDFFQKVYIPMQQNLNTFNHYAQVYDLKTIVWSKTDLTGWAIAFRKKILPQLEDWEKIYEDKVSLVYQKRPA